MQVIVLKYKKAFVTLVEVSKKKKKKKKKMLAEIMNRETSS